MIVKLLTEHHLEFLSLKGGYRGSSESTHVKMPHCWKSHALAQFFELVNLCRDRYLRAISGNFHAHNSSVETKKSFHPVCEWPILGLSVQDVLLFQVVSVSEV